MFRDRQEAGDRLAHQLRTLRGEDVVVLGLPRGGVPVAARVAEALDAPLDVLVVRKLGLPWQPELAMGAIAEGGVRVRNEDVLEHADIDGATFDRVEERERRVLADRLRLFRGGRAPVPVRGRTVVLVDDGAATGSTAVAACRAVRLLGARRVVVGLPVAGAEALHKLRQVADEVRCVESSGLLGSVGQSYRHFDQVPDDEVVALLQRARVARPATTGDPDAVVVDADGCRLPGRLRVPDEGCGLVVFAHGSGSSLASPRNRRVADVLVAGGLGTLLFDLLTPDEVQRRSAVFDVDLMARRLLAATRWVRGEVGTDHPVGYFGASTGAAAALWAAAVPDARVRAVVSRGGRPDLAAGRLAAVTAPTLLLVGSEDRVVLDLNRRAAAMLGGEVEVAVVPGAGHLFEEPGTLDEVARLATEWFVRHLPGEQQGDG